MASQSSFPRRSSRFGVYFLVSCALTLGIGFGLFELTGTHQQQVKPEAHTPDVIRLSEQVRSLGREVGLLRARQTSSEGEVRHRELFDRQDDGENGSREEPSFEESSTPPPEESAKEAEARVAARYEFLDSALKAEGRDPEWSMSTEESITALFRSETLGAAQLQTATCGSTMCKVEMSLASDSELDEFQREFTQGLRESLPRGTMRQVETVDGEARFIAYLARPESRIPTWEPGE